jgi:hypothetical protein
MIGREESAPLVGHDTHAGGCGPPLGVWATCFRRHSVHNTSRHLAFPRSLGWWACARCRARNRPVGARAQQTRRARVPLARALGAPRTRFALGCVERTAPTQPAALGHFLPPPPAPRADAMSRTCLAVPPGGSPASRYLMHILQRWVVDEIARAAMGMPVLAAVAAL